jgi:hypothetical protein
MNIAIIATDGIFLKKIAWITIINGGIYVGLSEKLAKGFKPAHVSYHADGSQYHSDSYGKAYPLGKKKPLNQIKGYEHLLIYEGPTELVRKGYFTDFSLKREDEVVYVDMHRLGKLWKFGVGMMEPFAFESLKIFFNQTFQSIYLITRSKPWLVVGFGPSDRPIMKETAATSKNSLQQHTGVPAGLGRDPRTKKLESEFNRDSL